MKSILKPLVSEGRLMNGSGSLRAEVSSTFKRSGFYARLKNSWIQVFWRSSLCQRATDSGGRHPRKTLVVYGPLIWIVGAFYLASPMNFRV